jgi:hypothetical protein
MVELCSKLDKDVADIDGVNVGLETRGAGLIGRASELHTRLESCGVRALEQVSLPLLQNSFRSPAFISVMLSTLSTLLASKSYSPPFRGTGMNF